MDAYYLLSQIESNPTEWICCNDMTDKEKEEHPEFKTTGGYLKEIDLSNRATEWWHNLNNFNKGIIRNIPNYNEEKFFKILGIKENEDD